MYPLCYTRLIEGKMLGKGPLSLCLISLLMLPNLKAHSLIDSCPPSKKNIQGTPKQFWQGFFLWVSGVLASQPVNFQKSVFDCQGWRLPSTQKSGSLPTKLGVKWVCTVRYQIFLFIIGILSPKWPLSGHKKHKIITRKNFLWKNKSWSIILGITGDLLTSLKMGH